MPRAWWAGEFGSELALAWWCSSEKHINTGNHPCLAVSENAEHCGFFFFSLTMYPWLAWNHSIDQDGPKWQ